MTIHNQVFLLVVCKSSQSMFRMTEICGIFRI